MSISEVDSSTAQHETALTIDPFLLKYFDEHEKNVDFDHNKNITFFSGGSSDFRPSGKCTSVSGAFGTISSPRDAFFPLFILLNFPIVVF